MLFSRLALAAQGTSFHDSLRGASLLPFRDPISKFQFVCLSPEHTKTKEEPSIMKLGICLFIVLLFISAISANAQGTPGALRCNLRGGLGIHSSRDPGSFVIGRVQCGDPVLIIDQRFGSPHIRTEDGKDGYIIG